MLPADARSPTSPSRDLVRDGRPARRGGSAASLALAAPALPALLLPAWLALAGAAACTLPGCTDPPPGSVPAAKTVDEASFAAGRDGPRLAERGGVPLESVVAGLEELIPRAMAREGVPGLSIALIVDGRVVWAKGFGVKDTTTGEPVTVVSAFRGASLTKPLVAYAALELCEKGVLELDRPLDDYLPEPYLDDPRVRDITLRMVLSHTSGFTSLEAGRGHIIRTPGTGFLYSNDAFRYLQHVLEHVTGRPLADHMAESVFRPLGMRETSLVWTPAYETLAARGHDGDRPLPLYRPTRANGAYGVYTTPTDYALFLIELMDAGSGDGHRLSRAYVDLMLTPHAKVSDRVSWGLGIGLAHAEDGGGDWFWQWGWMGGFRAYAAASQGRRTGVVIMTNGTAGLDICEEIAEEALGEPQPAFPGLLDLWID